MKKQDLLRLAQRTPEDCAGLACRRKLEGPQKDIALSRYKELMDRGETLRAAESARHDGLVDEMRGAARSEYTRLMNIASRTGDARHFARAFRVASGFGLGHDAIAAASSGIRKVNIEEEDVIDHMVSGSGQADDK